MSWRMTGVRGWSAKSFRPRPHQDFTVALDSLACFGYNMRYQNCDWMHKCLERWTIFRYGRGSTCAGNYDSTAPSRRLRCWLYRRSGCLSRWRPYSIARSGCRCMCRAPRQRIRSASSIQAASQVYSQSQAAMNCRLRVTLHIQRGSHCVLHLRNEGTPRRNTIRHWLSHSMKWFSLCVRSPHWCR